MEQVSTQQQDRTLFVFLQNFGTVRNHVGNQSVKILSIDTFKCLDCSNDGFEISEFLVRIANMRFVEQKAFRCGFLA